MRYLIIGSGVAGISAVKELIKVRDSSDSITVISDESYPFYYRPRLINCLSGDVSVEDIIINDRDWFRENNVDLKLKEKVKKIVPDQNLVITNKGKYSFDRLLLANGASSFVPPIPGCEKENVFTLRRAEDAKKIYKTSCDKKRAVVIGGGLLGLESAYNLKQNGLDVTVIERGPYLLTRQLDERGGKILKELLEDKGLNFVLDASTEKVAGDGKVEEVLVEDKGGYPADLVLLSTGIRSNIQLVEDTNINVNNGVIVNESMVTNLKNIYAAGDVAEYDGRVYGIWPPSMKQGQIAGKNMAGIDAEFGGFVSSYSLKVAGISLVSKGIIDEDTYQNDITEEDGKYKKIVYNNNKSVGVILIGDFPEKRDIINKIDV